MISSESSTPEAKLVVSLSSNDSATLGEEYSDNEIVNMITRHYGNLRTIPDMRFSGLNKELATELSRKVRSAHVDDPDEILDFLDAKKAKGNQAFKQSRHQDAQTIWNNTMRDLNTYSGPRMNKLMTHPRGGRRFANALTESRYNILCNTTQLFLTWMRNAREEGDEDFVDQVGKGFLHTVGQIENIVPHFRFTSLTGAFEPSKLMLAKQYYRHAAGLRILDELPHMDHEEQLEMMRRSLEAIQDAVTQQREPGILDEQLNIRDLHDMPQRMKLKRGSGRAVVVWLKG